MSPFSILQRSGELGPRCGKAFGDGGIIEQDAPARGPGGTTEFAGCISPRRAELRCGALARTADPQGELLEVCLMLVDELLDHVYLANCRAAALEIVLDLGPPDYELRLGLRLTGRRNRPASSHRLRIADGQSPDLGRREEPLRGRASLDVAWRRGMCRSDDEEDDAKAEEPVGYIGAHFFRLEPVHR
ncbi:MAG TPA: hypothetical protein VE911_03075 [Candidatus Nitrosopolaris sp.]|nr:hypothetical protein [Candidatus Nitrosopolaris sp.]